MREKQHAPKWKTPNYSVIRRSTLSSRSWERGSSSKARSTTRSNPKRSLKMSYETENPFMKKKKLSEKNANRGRHTIGICAGFGGNSIDEFIDSNAQFPNIASARNKKNIFLPTDFSSMNRPSRSSMNLPSHERKTLLDDFRLGTKLQLETKVRLSDFDNIMGRGGDLLALNMDKVAKWLSTVDGEYDEFPIENCPMEFQPFVKFLSCTAYWQFPNVTGLTLFPRLESLLGPKSERDAGKLKESLGEHFMETVMSEWFAAFDQLYQSWRKGGRQYFYVCYYTFTALFIKTFKEAHSVCSDMPKLSDSDIYEFRIIITPSSAAFREKLRREKIYVETQLSVSSGESSLVDVLCIQTAPPDLYNVKERFSHPMDSKSQPGWDQKPVFQVGDEPDSNGENTEIINTGHPNDENENSGNDSDDNYGWMSTLKLSPLKARNVSRSTPCSSTKILGQSRIHSLSLPILNSIDGQEDAMVITNNRCVQSFYNLLMSGDFGCPDSGPYAGLPPTLLAPYSFRHSSLKTLKCSVNETGKNDTIFHSYELTGGPVMSRMVRRLHDFLSTCPELCKRNGDYTVIISGRESCFKMHEAINRHDTRDYRGFRCKDGNFEYF